jgi:hypothetical protein
MGSVVVTSGRAVVPGMTGVVTGSVVGLTVVVPLVDVVAGGGVETVVVATVTDGVVADSVEGIELSVLQAEKKSSSDSRRAIVPTPRFKGLFICIVLNAKLPTREQNSHWGSLGSNG